MQMFLTMAVSSSRWTSSYLPILLCLFQPNSDRGSSCCQWRASVCVVQEVGTHEIIQIISEGIINDVAGNIFDKCLGNEVTGVKLENSFSDLKYKQLSGLRRVSQLKVLLCREEKLFSSPPPFLLCKLFVHSQNKYSEAQSGSWE